MQQERLGQAFRLRLRSVAEIDAELFAVTQ